MDNGEWSQVGTNEARVLPYAVLLVYKILWREVDISRTQREGEMRWHGPPAVPDCTQLDITTNWVISNGVLLSNQ